MVVDGMCVGRRGLAVELQHVDALPRGVAELALPRDPLAILEFVDNAIARGLHNLARSFCRLLKSSQEPCHGVQRRFDPAAPFGHHVVALFINTVHAHEVCQFALLVFISSFLAPQLPHDAVAQGICPDKPYRRLGQDGCHPSMARWDQWETIDPAASPVLHAVGKATQRVLCPDQSILGCTFHDDRTSPHLLARGPCRPLHKQHQQRDEQKDEKQEDKPAARQGCSAFL